MTKFKINFYNDDTRLITSSVTLTNVAETTAKERAVKMAREIERDLGVDVLYTVDQNTTAAETVANEVLNEFYDYCKKYNKSKKVFLEEDFDAIAYEELSPEDYRNTTTKEIVVVINSSGVASAEIDTAVTGDTIIILEA